MPVTKQAHARYQLINRELSQKDYVKTRHLRRALALELGVEVSERTIQNDIRDMKQSAELQYFAPIQYCGKNRGHYYTDKSFSIDKFSLQESEMKALKFYLGALSQYKHSLFKDFSNALQKLISGLDIQRHLTTHDDVQQIIHTDNPPENKGNKWLVIITKAIENCQIIAFNYQKFNETVSSKRKIKPHLLKEYHARWYVIGQEMHKDDFKTFGLDRITNLKLVKSNFEKSKYFNPHEYYKHSFGISTLDSPVEKVLLLFKKNQLPYLETVPIHPTQKIIKKSEEGILVSLEIIPSYEFYACILGYAELVKVISPEKISSDIMNRLKEAFDNYQLY